jgi:hypothetical protein
MPRRYVPDGGDSRNARLKGRVSPEQLAEVRAKIKALIG